MKICTHCEKPRQNKSFYKEKRAVDGLTWCCKFCSRQKYYDDAERIKKRQRARTRNRPELLMLVNARQRAKRRKVPCTITTADIRIPEFCPILGMKLVRTKRRTTPASPTLDCKNVLKGYIPGNVAVISWQANRMKSNATLEQLKQILEYAIS